MNTSAAAIQANVTVTTIRVWCRRDIITATKQAGRWIIDSASLAARIAIGAMRIRKATPVADTVDLTAAYTWTPAGSSTATTTTASVKTSTTPYGVVTTVAGLAPLLADVLDGIANEGDRLHTLTVLDRAEIVYCDTPDDEPWTQTGVTVLDRGQVCVQYVGTRDLPVQTVVDLALKLRTQLGL